MAGNRARVKINCCIPVVARRGCGQVKIVRRIFRVVAVAAPSKAYCFHRQQRGNDSEYSRTIHEPEAPDLSLENRL